MNFDRYRLRKGLILAFHGCDASTAAEVISQGQHLRASENAYDWLGSGVYFWENNPERAYEWARAAQMRGRIQSPAVVGAVLDLGLCLDLTETVGCEEVAEAFAMYQKSAAKGWTAPIRENSGGPDSLMRHRDCDVISLLHTLRQARQTPPFASVRAAFHEGGELYPGAGFSRKSHIQICLRDTASILGYFSPIE